MYKNHNKTAFDTTAEQSNPLHSSFIHQTMEIAGFKLICRRPLHTIDDQLSTAENDQRKITQKPTGGLALSNAALISCSDSTQLSAYLQALVDSKLVHEALYGCNFSQQIPLLPC